MTDQTAAPTENELKCLVACLNYPNRDTQIDDNMSNAGAAEFRKLLGWNQHQVAALIGSMEKKGYGKMDDEGVNGEPLDLFWLSDKAINLIFDMVDRGELELP